MPFSIPAIVQIGVQSKAVTTVGVSANGFKKTSPTGPGCSFVRQILPSDAIDSFTAIFDGVVAGCEIRVYSVQTGLEMVGVENCVANDSLTWNRFPQGSVYNNVRIRILGLTYRIKDFTFTTPNASSATIPIQQETDRWYDNP